MLLLGLTFFNINNVFAWHNTTVQNKTLYCQSGGGPAAKMGTTTQYGYIGPAGERSPQFYSALMAKGGNDECPGCYGFFYVRAMRIEITGIDPNGYTIPGDKFGDRTVLVSPDDSGVEQETLRIVWNVLVSQLPYGLDEIVKNTISEGGATTGYDGEKAWAEWTWSLGVPVLSCQEKGLRFGYELNVDPTLEGTYTINIHYSSVIYWDSGHGGGYEGTLDLYDTITYEYVNTPPAPSKPTGETDGYTYTTYTYSTSTTDPNGDSLRYQFYWGDGSYTLTGWYTSSATASASHSWSSTGYKYVKVRAQDSTGAWSDWSSSLTVYISSGGGGGGCPILSVYDGTGYALEGLLDIHNPDGIDVVASHVLIHTPEPVEHRYLLRLTEHPQTYSHIDQVKLFAMLTNGTEVKLPLVSAIHSEDGNVKQELLLSDNVRAEMLGADHNNGTSQYIDLRFIASDELEIETFTFIIEGHNIVFKV